jgi:2-methylisocitrate lyase-like PEP mutase family enzyme
MPRNTLRKRFDKGDHLLAAIAWDGMSAKIVERLGFDMVVVGSGDINHIWAVPDGATTPSQVVESVFRIRNVIKIPILVDMEQGYGGANEAAYWLQQLERAGASMVWVTDFPQTNATTHPAHINKKTPLASPEEHAKIIEAMVDARHEMIIGARTWAHAITGMTDAIRRLRIYRKSGADVLWAHYPEDKTALRRYKQELKCPIAVQTGAPGNHPTRVTGFLPNASFKELRDESVQLIICSGTYKLAYGAFLDALSEVRRVGNLKCLKGRMMDLKFDMEMSGETRNAR